MKQIVALFKTTLSGQYKSNDKQKEENPESKTLIEKEEKQNNCGCKKHKSEPFIGNYHEAPEWMRYQELTIGYRINFSSFKLIFRSIFMVHNETTNVWTHLVGAFLLIFTAFLTSTDLINVFYESTHQIKPIKPSQYRIGSGMSFLQNITQLCLNEQYLIQNRMSQYNMNINELAFDICQHSNNKYECYVKKSHQRKLRNWFEFHLGMPLNRLEQLKLIMEKDIVPTFVHQVQDRISNQSHHLLQYIHYYFPQKPNQNGQISTQIQSSEKQENKKQLAKWPLIIYLIGNSICLLCSVTYHLFYPLSQKAHSLCVCTDFAGISVLFGGSAIPCIYYGMYCYFEVAQVYLTGIVCASVAVFILSFTNKFQNRKSSTFRVIIYFFFACFMVTPLFHMSINELIFNNYDDTFSLVNSLEWYTLGLIFFAIGGFFYASHFPNCFSKTGKYDIIGHSHHYWHVFVVLAIFTIYIGCVENYFTRKDSICLA